MSDRGAAPSFDRVRTRWLPLWVAGGATVAVLASGPAADLGDGGARDLAVGYGLYAAVALWALRQCLRAGTSLRGLVGPAPRGWATWRLAGLAAPLVLLSLGTFWLLWLPLSFVAPDLVTGWALEPDPPIWVDGAHVRNVLTVLLLVVVAPVVEEVAFRGVMLHRWAHRWGPWRALLASSLAFGLLHRDVLGAIVFGVLMGLLYVRTGGLWMPIACHVANNAIAVAAELLPLGLSGDYTLARFRAEWYVGALALAAALPALWALRAQYLPPPGWRLPDPGGAAAVPGGVVTPVPPP